MEKEIRWATREKKIKANAKNRKKASKLQRRSGSKKKTKRNEAPRSPPQADSVLGRRRMNDQFGYILFIVVGGFNNDPKTEL